MSLHQWLENCDKKSAGVNTSGGLIKSKIMLNQQLEEELPKQIIRLFEKC